MYDWIGRFTKPGMKAPFWAKVLSKLPSWAIRGIADGLGLLVARSSGEAGCRIRRNMKELLPELGSQGENRLARRYYQHAVLTLMEVLLLRERLVKQETSTFKISGEANLHDALSRGKGAIVYTSHTGNFFYYYWLLSKRYNCLAVATATSPEIRPIYLSFQAMGCRGLDYDETPPLEMLRQLREHLAAGGIVFILGDFYRPNFPRARWMGKETRLPAGAASLALEFGAPVVPFLGSRGRGLQHELEIYPPLQLDEIYTMKQRKEAHRALLLLLEEMVRRKPEQWFYWFDAHERWGTPDLPLPSEASKLKLKVEGGAAAAVPSADQRPINGYGM